MTLVKYKNSFDPRFHSFNNFFDDFFTRDDVRRSPKANLPRVNVLENEDQFEIQVAAPGLHKDGFKVEVDNDRLTISYSENEEKKDESSKFTMREFAFKNFERSFTLPDTIASDKISANYVDGILKLNVPKREEAKPKPGRTINIG